MIKMRLLALMLAVGLIMNCVPYTWAADPPPEQAAPGGDAHATAALSNTVYVPGKAITCFTGGVVWTVAMLVTFGTCYKECGHFAHDVCTGKWIITAADMTDP